MALMAANLSVLDEIDRMIVDELILDSRAPASDVARRVGLSVSATAHRMRRLLDDGTVRPTVEIAPAAVGRMVEAIIDVVLPATAPFSALDEELLAMPQVIDAAHATGRFDYVLRLSCRDVPDLEQAIRTLKERLGVQETETRVVLHRVRGFPRQPSHRS